MPVKIKYTLKKKVSRPEWEEMTYKETAEDTIKQMAEALNYVTEKFKGRIVSGITYFGYKEKEGEPIFHIDFLEKIDKSFRDGYGKDNMFLRMGFKIHAKKEEVYIIAKDFISTSHSTDFLKTHVLSVEILESFKDIGFEVDVKDDGYYYEHRDIAILLEVKKDIDKSLENLKKVYLKCGFKFEGNIFKPPKEWSEQKAKKKFKIAKNLLHQVNREQGLPIDLIINGKIHKQNIAEAGWINKNDFQCYCGNVIKNIGRRFDANHKKGVKKAIKEKKELPLYIGILCKECYQKYNFLTVVSNEVGKVGFGFGMSEEEVIKIANMDKEEQNKLILEKKAEIEAERKFHIEWSPIGIEQITEMKK